MRKGRTSNSYHYPQPRKILPPIPDRISNINHSQKLHHNPFCQHKENNKNLQNEGILGQSKKTIQKQNIIQQDKMIAKNTERINTQKPRNELENFQKMYAKMKERMSINRNKVGVDDREGQEQKQKQKEEHSCHGKNNRNSFKIRKRNISLLETKQKDHSKVKQYAKQLRKIQGKKIMFEETDYKYQQSINKQISRRRSGISVEKQSRKRIPLENLVFNKQILIQPTSNQVMITNNSPVKILVDKSNSVSSDQKCELYVPNQQIIKPKSDLETSLNLRKEQSSHQLQPKLSSYHEIGKNAQKVLKRGAASSKRNLTQRKKQNKKQINREIEKRSAINYKEKKAQDIQKAYRPLRKEKSLKNSRKIEQKKKQNKNQSQKQNIQGYNISINIPTSKQIQITEQSLCPDHIYQNPNKFPIRAPKIKKKQKINQKLIKEDKQTLNDLKKEEESQILNSLNKKKFVKKNQSDRDKERKINFEKKDVQSRKRSLEGEESGSCKDSKERKDKSKKKKKIDECKTHKVLWGPLQKKPFHAGVSSIFLQQNKSDPPLESLKELYHQMK